MNIGQVAQGHGLTFTEVSPDSIQVALIPLVKTDSPDGWIARAAISRVTLEKDTWCVVFEVATRDVDITEPNIWMTEQAVSLNILGRFCTDNYGFMEIPSTIPGQFVLSRVTWNVDIVKHVGVVVEKHSLVLTGAVVYELPPELVVAGTLPIIHSLINQINQVSLINQINQVIM